MTAVDDSTEALTSALAKARVPAANHDFIRRFTSAIGIARYQTMSVDTTKPYVLATRHDRLPPLHIHYGFTSGFVTEAEIVRAAGADVTRAPSSRKGTWYVAHPINQIRPRGDQVKDRRREAGFCSCGMQLSLAGNCDYCS